MLTKLVRVGLTTAAILLAATTIAPAETSATPASVLVAQQSAPADFGSPPSGSVPILYNDHHVYTKPDRLKQGRVLAALVRHGTVLIPLRSMFEQMGASVTYDPSTKTADVSKPGADVKVTVGKPEVIINGESRPLDVAPISYHGDILVPVRVISEGMGAFVQWVPDRQLVVVRYLPPTPPPAPTEAPAAPTEAPTTAPVLAPPPKVHVNPLTIDGYVRSYDFYRQNAYSGKGGSYNNGGSPNQNSFNTAFDLHAQYTVDGFFAGATYLFADPFNACADTSTEYTIPACKSSVQDDTLPGFMLNTLYEGYVGYKGNGLNVKVGDQVINTPWANASDSRLKPNSFEGAIAGYNFAKHWDVTAGFFSRFEDRASSEFINSTLLTYNPVDAAHLTHLFNYSGLGSLQIITNPGFAYGQVGYHEKDLSANVYYYGFIDIANALWVDAKYTLSANPLKPFIAIQGGDEQNSGESLVGQISSTVYGVQGGLNPVKDLTLTAGYDDMPEKTAFISGLTCPANHMLADNKGLADYFMAPGYYNCVPGTGGATVYYGGWASPYTDSYATDPLFTTSLTQGMVDTRNFGQSFKAALSYTSDNKRFTAMVSRAFYIYGDDTVGLSNTQETDFDTMYHFAKVGKGPYHGFLLRYRYGERTETFTTPYLFKYNRFQAEYDF